jgi:site-specific recombinase XerD
MDRWAWDQLTRWQEIRATLPVGSMFCVIHGPTAGRRWEASAARKQLRRAAEAAGVRRRVAPHQLRHAHAVEMAHEGVPGRAAGPSVVVPTATSHQHERRSERRQ